MNELNIVKLNFSGPLHIGNGSGDYYDTSSHMLHSDTISGAIISAFVSLYGDEKLETFINSFKVSSAFPFKEDSFFIPKPKSYLRFKNSAGIVDGKNEKKIEFIDLKFLPEISSDNILKIDDEWVSKCGKFIFYHKQSNGVRLYKNELVQRVFVPRGGEDDCVPFLFDRRFFNADCGLYFMFEVEDEWRSYFQKSIDFLGTLGLGTDKNVGNGQFEPVYLTLPVELPANPNGSLLLSLWCPDFNEISDKILQNSSYQIIKRSGYIAGSSYESFRHLRKRSIHMFSEGSVFESLSLKGKIVDIRPVWNDSKLHKVYRDGRPFTIPCYYSN